MASEHDHNEVGESLKSGLNTANNARNAAKAAKKTAKKIKSLKTKEAAKKGAKALIKLIGGGLNPAIIYGLAGVIILVIVFSLLTTGGNASSLLTNGVDEATQNKIKQALTPAYNQNIDNNKQFIIDEINKRYNVKATLYDIVDKTSKEGTEIFTISNDYAEIDVVFEPDIPEYVSLVDSYANGVNSTLQAFNANKEVTSLTEESNKDSFEESLSKIDENGETKLTEYGKKEAKKYDSEFADSQSPKYFKTLKDNSQGMFSIDADATNWEYKEFKTGTKTRKIKSCYVQEMRYIGGQLSPTGVVQKVSCNTYSYDFTEMETITTTAWFGKVVIHTRCDPTLYKYNEVQNLIDRVTNEEMYLPKEIEEGETETEKRKPKDRNEASAIINNIISDYEMNYLLTMYFGESYGAGWTGLITSNGWNYSTPIDYKNSVVGNAFWAYSTSLKNILCDLKYKTDDYGGCPSFTKQCTQFAATFFYDVYGFAALRGNGSEQAGNLIKDCGETSSCPVKFQNGGAAPGAIVSLYPNHVIVIDEVDINGGVYISEGNRPHGTVQTHQYYAGGLSEYCNKYGFTVKRIAIPIQ